MSRRGFSLVELVVVVAILTLFLALLLVGVQAVRATAARAACQSRLRQLCLAAHQHHAQHGHFPEGVSYPFSKTDYERQVRHAGISWQTTLLPYLEQDAVWRQVQAAHAADPSTNGKIHQPVAGHLFPVLRCPNDPRPFGHSVSEPTTPHWGLTNYLGVAGTDLLGGNGLFHANLRVTTGLVRDGTSSTLMIGERPSGPNGTLSSWYAGWGRWRFAAGQLLPVDDDFANQTVAGVPCPDTVSVFAAGKYDSLCDHYHFWSLHPGGANFGFADGSVKFLPYSAAKVLTALATRSGGEAVSATE